MKLYDTLIGEVNELLSGYEIKELEGEDSLWPDAGNHHMILRKDMAYELGGGTYAAISGLLFSSKDIATFMNIKQMNAGENVSEEPNQIAKDKVFLIGPDLSEIQSDCAYARITFIEVDESLDEADYDTLKKIEYARFHVHPVGFMSRISTANNREPVRVSKKAIDEGLGFYQVGKSLLSEYHKISQVKSVYIIYITSPDFSYEILESLTKKSDQITESLNEIFQNLAMDCSVCGLKPICDEVEGMKELHFAHTT